MSENIVDKTLTVTSINTVTELTTGELMYQLTLGYSIRNTPEITNRVPANAREPFLMSKNVVVNEVTLLIKAEEIPYKVGSKWKMKIHKNGTLNLVEEK